MTNKLYLLSFGALLLLLVSAINFLINKKIAWQKGAFDSLLTLFLVALSVSIIISSPNKVQAILNPGFGLLTFFSLTVFYFYLSRRTDINFFRLLSISALFIALLTIIFFFQPLKNVNLPPSLQFFKNPAFTPLGSQLDLAVFLGFMTVYYFSILFDRRKEGKNSFNYYWLLAFNLPAFSLTLYSLLKPLATNFNQSALIIPPFRLSWYAAVEILKNPITAFFGVGVDNFASIFTRVKDIVYNQSNLWLISSFNYSRSAILHLFTEAGILGILAFSLILLQVIKMSLKEKKSLLPIGYCLLIILLFPPSLIVWFLFFLILTDLSIKNKADHPSKIVIDLTDLLPFYLTTAFGAFIFIIGGFYLLTQSYRAEIHFKKALDGVAKNNARQAYENIRLAIILNPYIEIYRINFSQLNLILANNIAGKANRPENSPAKKDEKTSPLTEQDRQNISQAIQMSISEAKAAINLNPAKAQYWQNLAEIYRNIINIAQQADTWTISAYQRAIVADPQNPAYRLNLGGIYYSLNNYDEALKMFEQAVVLKPDWPNAYYNLAWAYYQKQNYQAAVSAMENVIRLLDPKKDKADYDKVKKELEEFKKKLPEKEKEATEEAKTQPKLTLPSPIPTTTPQIQLPKEASPEAK